MKYFGTLAKNPTISLFLGSYHQGPFAAELREVWFFSVYATQDYFWELYFRPQLYVDGLLRVRSILPAARFVAFVACWCDHLCGLHVRVRVRVVVLLSVRPQSVPTRKKRLDL